MYILKIDFLGIWSKIKTISFKFMLTFNRYQLIKNDNISIIIRINHWGGIYKFRWQYKQNIMTLCILIMS